jgi:NTP pyrophosphatase (non-canonical NTP hydrolase)
MNLLQCNPRESERCFWCNRLSHENDTINTSVLVGEVVCQARAVSSVSRDEILQELEDDQMYVWRIGISE